MIEASGGLRKSGASTALAKAVCPVAMCLMNVVPETDARCAGSGRHLRVALGHLGLAVQPDSFPTGREVPSAPVLAAFLEYLLPDVQPHSEAAATSVRRAIHKLRGRVGIEGPLQ